MAKTAEKTPAEKKVVVSDLKTAISELDGGEQLQAAIDEGLVKAEIDEVEIEAGKYSGDYVKLSLGDKATDEASILAAMVAISGGNLTAPASQAKDAKEGDTDNRAPSVVKFFLYGADLAARSRTSQRIKSAAEGPEKNIEKMAQLLVKSKPGLSLESAREQAKAFLED